MTSRDFVYWLQGFFEINEVENGTAANVVLSARQTECIKKHLAMVFIHEIDPAMGDGKHQAALTAAHGGGAPAQPPKPSSLSEAIFQGDPMSLSGADGMPRFNC